MSTTIEELQHRLEAVEAEVKRLRWQAPSAIFGRPPQDGTIHEWLAAIRKHNAETLGPLHEEVRRAFGIPPDLPDLSAKEIRDMMIADGVRPEDCIASSEIIRMREE